MTEKLVLVFTRYRFCPCVQDGRTDPKMNILTLGLAKTGAGKERR